MKNLTSLALMCLFISTAIAQVGINNVSPNASLDITASNQAAPSNTDGMLVPRVDDFPASNPGAAQTGMLVYLTTTSGSNPPGFYYWDNGTTSWIAITGSGADEINELSDGIYDGSSLFLGTGAGTNDDGSNFNTALGLGSMASVTSGFQNTALGYFSLRFNTTGQHNTAVGSLALYRTTGSYNTSLGSNSLASNISGSNNTAIGYLSSSTNTSGYQNTSVGVESLRANSVGFANAAIGYRALLSNNSGRFNTAVGAFSSDAITTGVENTAIGYNSLSSNRTGYYNVALGSRALSGITAASYNIAIGQNAISSVTTSTAAAYNIGIGNNTMGSLSSGSRNIAIGSFGLNAITSGIGNVGIGIDALRNTSSSSYNTAIGYQAGMDNSTGFQNTYVGYQSGENGNSARYNTFIGADSGFSNSSGANNIFIGYRAGYTETSSNKLYIDPSSTTTPLIYGDFATDDIRINGGLQVGNPATTGYELPPVDGTIGQTIVTNGAGVLAWGDGGNQTVDTFTFNGATDELTLEIENDGIPALVLDLTDVDDQTIETFAINPITKVLSLGLDNDGVVDSTVDLTSVSNTLGEAYNNGGAGAGRTINALDGAVTVAGQDGFMVTGAFNTGNTVDVTGAGTRMFFNPRKAAFRAGSVGSGGIYDATAWDNSNIGDRSFATNIGTIASGSYSFASGQVSVASGTTSTAMGYGTLATGFYEMAVGSWNTTGTDRLFVVGNGFSSVSRSNALEVFNDGRVEINDAYTLPTTDGTSGQVLQTNGSGTLSWTNPGSSNRSIARATMGGQQNISAGATNRINFTVETFDTQGNYDNGTSRFTASTAGVYRVNVFLYSPGGISSLRLQLQRNGSIYEQCVVNTLGRQELDTLVYLNAGEYLEIFMQNTGGSLYTVGGTSYQNYVEFQQVD